MAGCKRAQIFCIKLDGSESVPFIMKKDRLLVGRGDSCEIRVHVDGVASEHCAITMDQEGRAYLEPLDNCGLTFLNNSVIAEKILLEHNDMFKVVTRSFRFAYPETSAYFKTVTKVDVKKGNKESSRYETKSMVKSLMKNDNSSPSAALFDMKLSERKCMKQLLFRRQSLPNTAKLSLYKKCQHSLRSSQKSQASFSKRSSYAGFQKNSVKKEKLEENTTKKRVTFGPRLSPEEFDKNLPPASPLRRGSLPSASPFDQNLLKYQSDFESQKVHGIKKPFKNYSVSSPKKRLEFTSPVAPKPILKESESKKNCDLSPHLLRENKQHEKVPLFSEVLKKPAKNDSYAIKQMDKVPFKKRRPKVKKMVLRSQVLSNKSPRQAFHQRILGVASTGHANSPDTIFICKKKAGTVNKELSAKKIQGEYPAQHIPSEVTPNRNKKCKDKGKTLTENEVIPSPEACQLGRSSETNHVGPENLPETKNKDISVLKMKSPMKEITDKCVLENKKSCDEMNINFATCSNVDQVTEPKRNSRNDFNSEEVPFTPVIMDTNNLSTPKCLPKRKNSFRKKSLNEKTDTGKDLLTESCKVAIVTDSKCNKVNHDKTLKIVNEDVQFSVCHGEPNKEKDLLSENCETVIVTSSECSKLNDDKALKVVDKAVQSCSVCDEKADARKNLLSKNCETVIVTDSECNKLSDDKALKVVDKAVQSCSVCDEKTNKEKDLLAENCKTVIATDSECNKLSDDKALEVIDKAVQSCSVCPKFGSNFFLNDSCTSTDNLLRKLIFKVSMLNAFELYKQIIHNRDFFLKSIPHLCTPENTEEFDKRHPVNTWKEFLEQVEGFENQKLLEGMLQVSCLQSPFHELFPSISSIFKPGEADGDKKNTSVMKYNQGHSQEQLLLNSCSERMICSSAVKLQEPNVIDSFCGSAMCSKISSVSGTDNKRAESRSNENEDKQQYCLQNNKCVTESCQSPSNAHESVPERRTLRSRMLDESVDTRDIFKKSMQKEKSVEECLFNTLISLDTQEKECSESEIRTACSQILENLIDCKIFEQTDSQKAEVSKKSHKFDKGKSLSSCDTHLETSKNVSASGKNTRKKRNVNRLRQSLLIKGPVSSRTRLQRSIENDKSTEVVTSVVFVKAGESSGSAMCGSHLEEIKHVAKKRIRKNKKVSGVIAAKTVNKREEVIKSEAYLADDKIKCVGVETINSFGANESPLASGVDHNHILPPQKKTRRCRVMIEASTEQNRSEKKKAIKTKNMVDGNIKCVAVAKTMNSLKHCESPGVNPDQTILPSHKKTRRRRVIAEAFKEQNRNEKENVLKNEENMLDYNIKCIDDIEALNSCKLYESSKASETDLSQIVLSSKKRKRKDATETSEKKTKRKKIVTKMEGNLICANTEQSGILKNVEVKKNRESSEAHLKQTALPSKKRTKQVTSKTSTAKSKKKNAIKIERNLNDVNVGLSGLTKDTAFLESVELFETDAKDIVFISKKRKRKDASETTEAKTKSKKARKENSINVNAEVTKDVEIYENFQASETGINQITLQKKGKRKDISEVPRTKIKSKKKNVTRIAENQSNTNIKHHEIRKDIEVGESCVQNEKNVKISFFKQQNEKVCHFPSRSVTTRSMVK